MAAQREKLLPSPCRDQSVEENLRIWNEMKKGSEEGKKYCLRAKIDPAHKNSTMRDPALYRVVLHPPHIRTGYVASIILKLHDFALILYFSTKYKVYPLYDMICPIADSLEGVTHAMRSNEYHQRDEQYYWVWFTSCVHSVN